MNVEARANGIELLRANAPFPIRGHHLGWFFKAGREGVGDESLPGANAVMETVTELVTNIESCDDPEYIRDVLGNTTSQKESVIYSYVNVFTHFNTLPDDYPITVNSNPDLICQSCPIGRHCGRQPHYGDDRYTRRLYRFIRHHSFFDEAIPLPRDPEEKETNLSLATTAEIVRKTFAFMREHTWNF